MWRNVIHGGQETDRSHRACTALLTTTGLLAVAIGIVSLGVASQGRAQEAATAEKAKSKDALVETETVVEGQPERISDWALAGVVWSDAHLVRKLAQKAAGQAEDPKRTETMKALVRDSDQIIEILKEFGWRRLQARRAASDAAAVAANKQPIASPAAVEAAPESAPAVPPPGLPRRVETESPPGLNDPGVDDELLPHAFDFDLRRYRVDDYIDEVPAERRSLADAVEDAAEGALAAGVDNVSGTYGVGPASGRLSQRELMTRSNTLPYSKDSIYDTDDFDPNVDYDVDNPLTEPIPSDTNPLIENVEDEDLENRPIAQVTPEAVPSDVPDVDSEDDLVQGLVKEGEVPAATDAPATTPAAPAAAVSDLRRYTEQEEQFAQDAAWVQFQFDANQRTWQMMQAQPSKESLRRYLDAAIAQLQAHAQVGERLTGNGRLAAILGVVGGEE